MDLHENNAFIEQLFYQQIRQLSVKGKLDMSENATLRIPEATQRKKAFSEHDQELLAPPKRISDRFLSQQAVLDTFDLQFSDAWVRT